jgi:hypothetical protein
VLARQKTDIGLERMVSLASHQDPLVRAVAAESIGDLVIPFPKMNLSMFKQLYYSDTHDVCTVCMYCMYVFMCVGEEIWMDNRKQSQAQKIGAVDALLAIAANKDEAADSVVNHAFFSF